MENLPTIEVPDIPPSRDDEQSPPTVLNPRPGKKSIYWACYYEYDLRVHPDKVGVARCKICGADIKCNSGTGGIKKHIGYKHPKELEKIERGKGWTIVNEFADRSAVAKPQTPPAAPVKVSPEVDVPAAGAAVRPAVTPAQAVAPAQTLLNEDARDEVALSRVHRATAPPPKKRKLSENHPQKHGSNFDTILSNEEIRSREKHWMDIWITISRELNRLRKEFKEADAETEEEFVEEIKMDMEGLKKKKREVAELLGMTVNHPSSEAKELENDDNLEGEKELEKDECLDNGEQPEKKESLNNSAEPERKDCLAGGEEPEIVENVEDEEDPVTSKDVKIEKEEKAEGGSSSNDLGVAPLNAPLPVEADLTV